MRSKILQITRQKVSGSRFQGGEKYRLIFRREFDRTMSALSRLNEFDLGYERFMSRDGLRHPSQFDRFFL